MEFRSPRDGTSQSLGDTMLECRRLHVDKSLENSSPYRLTMGYSSKTATPNLHTEEHITVEKAEILKSNRDFAEKL
ncbi:hypothetical protein C1H46_006037 [Malus baccata]|uniref:Uncharacterized protein n=1 Tax=Malus baccata TaxID=106549 RepID=A0A540NBJ3_MALBA|nr:hypothetical protein C1H46_006037 [Malus baccata]